MSKRKQAAPALPRHLYVLLTDTECRSFSPGDYTPVAVVADKAEADKWAAGQFNQVKRVPLRKRAPSQEH